MWDSCCSVPWSTCTWGTCGKWPPTLYRIGFYQAFRLHTSYNLFHCCRFGAKLSSYLFNYLVDPYFEYETGSTQLKIGFIWLKKVTNFDQNFLHVQILLYSFLEQDFFYRIHFLLTGATFCCLGSGSYGNFLNSEIKLWTNIKEKQVFIYHCS